MGQSAPVCLQTIMLVIWIFAILSGVLAESNNSTKTGRTFSLFSIVQFPNEVCTSSSSTTTYGTCYTSSECSSAGGSADGNCAAGFGVCCVIYTSTCGATVTTNTTYIRNPHHRQGVRRCLPVAAGLPDNVRVRHLHHGRPLLGLLRCGRPDRGGPALHLWHQHQLPHVCGVWGNEHGHGEADHHLRVDNDGEDVEHPLPADLLHGHLEGANRLHPVLHRGLRNRQELQLRGRPTAE